jgi:hypothetical protein
MTSIKENEVVGEFDSYGGRRGAYRVLVEKAEGRRPLIRTKGY